MGRREGVELSNETVDRLRAERCFTPNGPGICVNEIIMFLHDEALSAPQASTSTSTDTPSSVGPWEAAGVKWRKYKQTIAAEILNTEFQEGAHPKKGHYKAWYAKSLNAVDVLVGKCISGTCTCCWFQA